LLFLLRFRCRSNHVALLGVYNTVYLVQPSARASRKFRTQLLKRIKECAKLQIYRYVRRNSEEIILRRWSNNDEKN
jgi:hypothetical protein